jgi:hypothetical protein
MRAPHVVMLVLLSVVSPLGVSAPVRAQVAEARDAVATGSTSPHPPRPTHQRGSRRRSSGSGVADLVLALFALGGSDPWAYRPHPYHERRIGYAFDPEQESERTPQRTGFFLGTYRIGYLLGEVGQFDVGLTATLGPISFRARQRLLLEGGRNGVTALGIGSLGVGFRLGQTDIVRTQLHLEFAHAEDEDGTWGGGSLGFDVDVYPGQPYAIAFELSGGFVGHAWLVDAAISFGILEGPVELHVGWSVITFVNVEDGVPVVFHGPTLVMRTWGS